MGELENVYVAPQNGTQVLGTSVATYAQRKHVKRFVVPVEVLAELHKVLTPAAGARRISPEWRMARKLSSIVVNLLCDAWGAYAFTLLK